MMSPGNESAEPPLTNRRVLLTTPICALLILAVSCTPQVKWREPVRVEPTAAGEIISYDVNGDGRIDYTQETRDGLKVRFRFDRDEDGLFEQTVARDELDPDATRHVFVVLDGVPFELIRQLYDEGHFRLFHPPGRLISTLPSLTDPMFSQIFACGPCPGYEASFYDRTANRITSGFSTYLEAVNEHWCQGLDYRISPWADAQTYLSPVRLFHQELAAARRALDKSRSNRVVLYILSTDAVCHIVEWEQAKAEFIILDHWLERIFFDYHGRIHLTIFADHGNNFVPSKRVDIEGALEHAGLKLSKTLRGPQDVAFPKFGLINFAALFTRNVEAKRRVVHACRQLEGVELVIYQDTPSPYDPIIVANRDAVARVFYRRTPAKLTGQPPIDSFRYDWDPAQGDPLQLAPIVEALRADGLIDKEGFATDHAWLAATWDHVFPDPLRRVHECLHGVVLNGADVVLSLGVGWYTGSRIVDVVGNIRGTHGSLRDSSSTTFLMSTAFVPPEYLRGDQLLVEINEHLEWVPHIPDVFYDRVLPRLQPPAFVRSSH
jgi:hypothetical protein